MAGIFYLAVSVAFFRPSLGLLPRSGMRYRSPGLLALFAAFLIAAFARHWVLAGAEAVSVALSLSVWLAVLMLCAGSRVNVVALWLAAWLGIDLVVIALALAGMDIGSATFKHITLIWEVAAAFVAVARYTKDTARQA